MTAKNSKLPRDSMIAYIPLSVTADLGVAMRRVRAKRIEKIKQICPSLFQSAANNSGLSKEKKSQKGTTGSCGGGGGSVSQISDADDSDNASQERRDGGGGNNEDDREVSAPPASDVRREQFGSIVEYLEAKYAKGVMIDDLDERIRQRKKQKKQKSAQGEAETDGAGAGEGDDMSVLSDSAAGSCYSIESGNFIDDSELRKEVAHQILGSSAYGKTKIEAEATCRGRTADDDGDSMIGDDDHGFFVNVGDLEMEDGWTEHDLDDDDDWMKMMGKVKSKKRKRSTKDSIVVKESEKTKKKVKKTANNDEKNMKKKNTNSADSKKKETNTSDKKKNTKAKIPPKEKQSKSPEKIVKNIVSTGVSSDDKKTDTKATPNKESKEVEEAKAKVDACKKDCTNLKRRVNRLYKKCVDEIKKMTQENLPRKGKKGGKSKVSITVPDGKKTGDKISFNNPHDPSQKLQVLIPENYEAGDTFKVSVPMPSVTNNGENKFTKECINALDEYSNMYDEWCQAEARYRELPSKRKLPEFKVGTERLKKYDQMLEEFPKNLQIPVDAPFLRKIVRRRRQNENKRQKSLEESVKKVDTVKVEKKKKKREQLHLNLDLPCKGKQFREIEFKVQDFGK